MCPYSVLFNVYRGQHRPPSVPCFIDILRMQVQTLREAACNGACHRGLDRKRVENSRERVIKRGEEKERKSVREGEKEKEREGNREREREREREFTAAVL